MENKEFSTPINQKKLYKFNATDVFLILIIAIAAAILIYIVAGTDLFMRGDEVTIQYTIEIPLIRNEFLPAINNMQGEQITDAVRGYNLGVVHQVRILDGMADGEDRVHGVVRRVPYPDHWRVFITVRAQARRNYPRYFVNGRNIMVGVQMFFRTPHFTGYGNCIELTEITEED